MPPTCWSLNLLPDRRLNTLKCKFIFARTLEYALKISYGRVIDRILLGGVLGENGQ